MHRRPKTVKLSARLPQDLVGRLEAVCHTKNRSEQLRIVLERGLAALHADAGHGHPPGWPPNTVHTYMRHRHLRGMVRPFDTACSEPA